MSRSEAQKRLTKLHLQALVSYSTDCVRAKADTVLAQDPAPGGPVDIGVTVHLSVADEKVAMPEVVDQPLSDSLDMVASCGLHAQLEFSHSKALSGNVYSTNAENALVQRDGTVLLKVSTGKKPPWWERFIKTVFDKLDPKDVYEAAKKGAKWIITKARRIKVPPPE